MSFELKNPPPQAALRFLTQEQMLRYSALPLDYNEESRILSVAVADARDFDLINDIQVSTGVFIRPVQADEEKIVQWIGAFAERAVPSFGNNTPGSKSSSPVIRLVNEIIYEAMHTVSPTSTSSPAKRHSLFDSGKTAY